MILEALVEFLTLGELGGVIVNGSPSQRCT